MVAGGRNSGYKRHRNGQRSSIKSQDNTGGQDHDDQQDDELEQTVRTSQVLPIADLPQDFDGEVDDGATFLALANRANSSLPFFTRVPAPQSSQLDPIPLRQTQAVASSSRHPALPSLSWTSGFPSHFRDCKETVAQRWPPDPLLAYPSHLPPPPRFSSRGEVWNYINGQKRKLRIVDTGGSASASASVDGNRTGRAGVKIKSSEEEVEEELSNGFILTTGPKSASRSGPGGGKEEASTNKHEVDDDGDGEDRVVVTINGEAYDENEEWGLNGDEGVEEDDEEQEQEQGTVPQAQEQEADEEAFMNVQPQTQSQNSSSSRPKPIKVLEEEEERHRTHEPLVSVLQRYNSNELVLLISQLTTLISEAVENLTPFVLIPTPRPQPDAVTSDISANSTSGPDSAASAPASTITAYNPFPIRYMHWIYACLLLIDSQLDGNQISTLRELARVAMRVGAWRWIKGVTDGEVVEGDPAGDGDGKGEGGWYFGRRWKGKSDSTSTGKGTGNGTGAEVKVETGVDETLARCWIVVYAVAGGWAQRDLLDDLENMFK